MEQKRMEQKDKEQGTYANQPLHGCVYIVGYVYIVGAVGPDTSSAETKLRLAAFQQEFKLELQQTKLFRKMVAAAEILSRNSYASYQAKALAESAKWCLQQMAEDAEPAEVAGDMSRLADAAAGTAAPPGSRYSVDMTTTSCGEIATQFVERLHKLVRDAKVASNLAEHDLKLVMTWSPVELKLLEKYLSRQDRGI
jgi:hypothetical protein